MTIPVGYAQSNLIFGSTQAPEGAEVTFGWDIGGFSGTPAEAGAIVGGAFVTEVLPFLTDGVQLQGVLMKFGPDASGPSALVGYANTGSSTSAGAPPQVSYLVHKNTALGGRAGRGRMYLPGVGEDKNSPAGVVDGTFQLALEEGLADWLITVGVGLLDPVVLHGPGSPISTPTPITSLTVDGRVATQRRRLRG